MKIFRDMPFVQLLLVALAVLLVAGVFVADEALAKVDIEIGGEGDPGDGNDIIRGGSGENGNLEELSSESSFGSSNNRFLFFLSKKGIIHSDFILVPVFENGRVIWFLDFAFLEGDGK